MALDGVSSYKIAQQFNTERIKTPIEYKIERGIASMKPKGESLHGTLPQYARCSVMLHMLGIWFMISMRLQKLAERQS